MALKTPIEIIENIILLNDDDINFVTGEFHTSDRNYFVRDQHHSGRPVGNITPKNRLDVDASCHIYPKQIKACAKVMGMVCSRWNSFVQESPRLWLGLVLIAPFGSPTKEALRKLQDAKSIWLPMLTNCDVDIDIGIPPPPSGASEDLAGFMQSFDCLSGSWRSLAVSHFSTGSPLIFPPFQQRLSRLIMLKCGGVTFDFEYGTVSNPLPSLRFAKIGTAGWNNSDHFHMLKNAECLVLAQSEANLPMPLHILQATLPKPRILVLTGRGPSPQAAQIDSKVSTKTHGVEPEIIWLTGNWSLITTSLESISPNRLSSLILEVRDDTEFQDMRLVLSSLRVLRFRGHPLKALDALLDRKTFKQLEILDLSCSIHSEISTFSSSLPLHSLKKLTIHSSAPFLSGFDAPLLEEFAVEMVGPRDATPEDPNTAFPRVFPKLSKLTLSGDLDVVRSLAGAECPSLHTLDLRIVRPLADDHISFESVYNRCLGALSNVKDLTVSPFPGRHFEGLVRQMTALKSLNLVENPNPHVSLSPVCRLRASPGLRSSNDLNVLRDHQSQALHNILDILETKQRSQCSLEFLTLTNFSPPEDPRLATGELFGRHGLVFTWCMEETAYKDHRNELLEFYRMA